MKYLLPIVLAGCSVWPDIDANDRLPLDPRLGGVVAESSPLRPSFLDANTDGWAVLYEGAGEGVDFKPVTATLHAFRLDPKTGAGTRLADPPLTPTSQVEIATSVDGEFTIVAGGDQPGVATLVNSTWTTAPYPPDYRIGGGDDLVLSRGGALAATTSSGVYTLVSGVWQKISPGGYRFGPWDANGMRLVYPNGGGICTTLDGANEICSPTNFLVEQIAGNAVNGTTDRFQVLSSSGGIVIALLFDHGVWTMTNAINSSGEFASTPGQDFTYLVRPHAVDEVNEVLRVQDGLLGDVVFPAFVPKLSCSCMRGTDPGCDCIARPVVAAIRVGTPGGLLISVDTVDAKRQMHALPLQFPVADVGW